MINKATVVSEEFVFIYSILIAIYNTKIKCEEKTSNTLNGFNQSERNGVCLWANNSM